MGMLGETPGAAQNNEFGTSGTKKVLNQRSEKIDADQETQENESIQQKVQKKLEEDSAVLTLSNEKLQNLGDLQKMPNLQDLQKIDISRNFLDNIDALNDLQRLKVIVATDNYIKAVNLQLPKLQELNLDNNFIETVPILSQMPQLKVLILNANNITELKLQCKDQNYVNIMKMVFRNNQIRFTNMEVINFVKTLKMFKTLRVLNLEHNPFENDKVIKEKIIRGLPQSLELYNNQRKMHI